MSESRSADSPPGGPALSRRDALVGALGAVAAGGVIVTAGPAAAAPPRVARPKANPHPVYRRSRFVPRVGTVVPVADVPDARLRLEGIRDISDGRGGVATGHEYAFGLRFRQVNGPNLAQGMHTLRYPGVAPVELFLSAVGPTDRRRYEAVVNRLVVG